MPPAKKKASVEEVEPTAGVTLVAADNHAVLTVDGTERVLTLAEVDDLRRATDQVHIHLN